MPVLFVINWECTKDSRVNMSCGCNRGRKPVPMGPVPPMDHMMHGPGIHPDILGMYPPAPGHCCPPPPGPFPPPTPKPEPPCPCPPKIYRNPPDVIVEGGDNIEVTSRQEEMDLRTVYTVSATEFEPATETEDGISGTVPAPSKGSGERVLHSDGTWKAVEIPLQTTFIELDDYEALEPWQSP